jgi:xylulokinase
MPQEAYLGLDVGGTGAKAGLVDGQGRLLAMAHRPYHPHLSADGHAEIAIDTVYAAAREAAGAAIRECGAHVRALSIASQGQTFVSLDDQDAPLHPAIVWYDARAAEQSRRLAQSLEAAHLGDAAPVVNPMATAPKVMWLREHFPALMARARRFLLLPDYFAYRLTGRAVTDPCTAASTGLYAEDAPDYCAAALAFAGIDKAQVAEIQSCGRPMGKVLKKSADEWGLDAETLVVTGTNDQYAGALGAGNCRPGIVSVTTGTCLALVTLAEHLPQPMPAGLLGGRFPITLYQFALAYSKTAGVVLEWFNRELAAGLSLAELDAMAARVPVGSHGVVMLPHFDGRFSPVPDPDVRGGFLNLALHSTRADMYRATLEALGYTLCECMALLRECGLPTAAVRAIGGCAKSDIWLQLSADIVGMPIERPENTEAATLGAAMIAAVGAGDFLSLEECSAAFYKRQKVFVPDPEYHALYAEHHAFYAEQLRRVAGNFGIATMGPKDQSKNGEVIKKGH